MGYHNKPPKWAPDAIPTKAGWKHPRTREILVSVKLSDDFISSYGKEVTKEVSVKVDETPEVKEEKKPTKKKR